MKRLVICADGTWNTRDQQTDEKTGHRSSDQRHQSRARSSAVVMTRVSIRSCSITTVLAPEARSTK